MDVDDAAKLEQQSLAAEEASDIEAVVDVKVLPTDTKAKRLLERIEHLRAAGYPQAIVFTQYTDTMDFLRERLRKNQVSVMCYSGRGGEVTEPSGAWRAISRDETKRRFRERKAEVLLATDAAAEGLNFQFCGALVNYDMPWNPMRVEQRIGRITGSGRRSTRSGLSTCTTTIPSRPMSTGRCESESAFSHRSWASSSPSSQRFPGRSPTSP